MSSSCTEQEGKKTINKYPLVGFSAMPPGSLMIEVKKHVFTQSFSLPTPFQPFQWVFCTQKLKFVRWHYGTLIPAIDEIKNIFKFGLFLFLFFSDNSFPEILSAYKLSSSLSWAIVWTCYWRRALVWSSSSEAIKRFLSCCSQKKAA